MVQKLFRGLAVIPILVLLVIIAATPAWAADLRGSDDTIVIGSGDVIDDDLYLAGQERDNPNTPAVRLGPLAAYVIDEEPGGWFDKPTLILIVNWWLEHRYRKLLATDFVAQNVGAVCFGPPATGKTHLALALGHAACWRDQRVRFARCAVMLDHLQFAVTTSDLGPALKQFVTPALLILDELVCLHSSPEQADLLYQVIEDMLDLFSVPKQQLQKSGINMCWRYCSNCLGQVKTGQPTQLPITQ